MFYVRNLVYRPAYLQNIQFLRTTLSEKQYTIYIYGQFFLINTTKISTIWGTSGTKISKGLAAKKLFTIVKIWSLTFKISLLKITFVKDHGTSFRKVTFSEWIFSFNYKSRNLLEIHMLLNAYTIEQSFTSIFKLQAFFYFAWFQLFVCWYRQWPFKIATLSIIMWLHEKFAQNIRRLQCTVYEFCVTIHERLEFS